MSKQECIMRAMLPWLPTACFLAIGAVALVAAPPPFVQHLYARGPGDCGPENPCPNDPDTGEPMSCCTYSDGNTFCQPCPCGSP